MARRPKQPGTAPRHARGPLAIVLARLAGRPQVVASTHQRTGKHREKR
jgi:hypothetical protein